MILTAGHMVKTARESVDIYFAAAGFSVGHEALSPLAGRPLDPVGLYASQQVRALPTHFGEPVAAVVNRAG